jgi:hypothetical protein
MKGFRRLTYEEGAEVMGQSPIALPSFCVKCGDHGVKGEYRSERLRYHPRWFWLLPLPVLGVLFPPLFGLAIIPRGYTHPLSISYFLCHKCIATRKLRKKIALMGWSALLVMGVVVVMLVDRPMLGIVEIVLVVSGVCAALSYRHPLLASGYNDGVFTVRGTTEAFHAAMKRM